MDGGDTICADMYDGDDLLYLYLCYCISIYVLSLDVRLQRKIKRKLIFVRGSFHAMLIFTTFYSILASIKLYQTRLREFVTLLVSDEERL